MVIGDEKGRVGVGTATAKEVVDAVQKGVSCSMPTLHGVKPIFPSSEALQLPP